MTKRNKLGRMNELAWVLGILLCALGVSLCTKAGFGLSMIAAPAYIFHRALIGLSPFFSQGTCEYLWQGLLMLLLCVGIRRFRPHYLLSFGTGILFGLAVDGWLTILGGNGVLSSLPLRILLFAFGMLFTSLAIAFFFRTGLPVEVYELLVSEVADRYHFSVGRVKQVNDLAMLLVSVLLALLLHRSLEGVGVGTVLITLFNAPLIALFGRLLDRIFDFSPRFPRLVKLLGGA